MKILSKHLVKCSEKELTFLANCFGKVINDLDVPWNMQRTEFIRKRSFHVEKVEFFRFVGHVFNINSIVRKFHDSYPRLGK